MPIETLKGGASPTKKPEDPLSSPNLFRIRGETYNLNGVFQTGDERIQHWLKVLNEQDPKFQNKPLSVVEMQPVYPEHYKQYDPPTWGDTALEVGKNLARPLATAAGAAAASPSAVATGPVGPAAAGLAAGMGVDLLFQKLQGDHSPGSWMASYGFVPQGSVADSIAAAGENMATDWAVGKVFSWAGRKLMGLHDPQDPFIKDMAKNVEALPGRSGRSGITAGQAKDSATMMGIEMAGASSVVNELREAQRSVFWKTISDFFQNPDLAKETSHSLAKEIVEKTLHNRNALMEEGMTAKNMLAAMLKSRGEVAVSKAVSDGGAPIRGFERMLLSGARQGVTEFSTAAQEVVIPLTKSQTWARGYLKQHAADSGNLTQVAKDILNAPQGMPVSQILSQYYYSNLAHGIGESAARTKLPSGAWEGFLGAMEKDLDNVLSKDPVPGVSQVWKGLKNSMSQWGPLFGEDSGSMLNKLITGGKPLQVLDDVLSNPKSLSEILAKDGITIPSATGSAIQLSKNIKSDLKFYALSRLQDKFGKTVDPKALEDFFVDPNGTMKMLFTSEERASLGQAFNTLARWEHQSASKLGGVTSRVPQEALYLTTAIAAGALGYGGGSSGGKMIAGVITGTGLSYLGVAQLFARNPKMSRSIAAFLAGEKTTRPAPEMRQILTGLLAGIEGVATLKSGETVPGTWDSEGRFIPKDEGVPFRKASRDDRMNWLKMGTWPGGQ